MSTPDPDPVHQLLHDAESEAHAAANAGHDATITPINDTEALAHIMDAAAREARQEAEEDS